LWSWLLLLWAPQQLYYLFYLQDLIILTSASQGLLWSWLWLLLLL
jgi:hypothetical protein